MRIAVLVYGRLHKCAEHYENIIWTLGKEHDVDFFLSSDNSSEDLLNDFIRLYKPVRYINEPIKYTDELSIYPGKPDETNIRNMTCHFMNKGRVFSLLEDYLHIANIHYECVVSLRVDLVFSTICDFTGLDRNTIYIPNGFDYVSNGINDQFAYGSFEVMKKYCAIFSNTQHLLKEGLSIPHPESLTYANLLYSKVDITRVDVSHVIQK